VVFCLEVGVVGHGWFFLHGWTGWTGFLKKEALPSSYPEYPVYPCLRVLLASGEAFEFEFWVSEVDEETDLNAGRVEVVDDLGLMLGKDGFHCLEFDEAFVFHQEISIEDPDVLAPKRDLDLFLRFYSETRLSESQGERLFINRFQKAAAEFVDHLECLANNLTSEVSVNLILFILLIHVRLCCFPFEELVGSCLEEGFGGHGWVVYMDGQDGQDF
jgi:hypothetical protein